MEEITLGQIWEVIAWIAGAIGILGAIAGCIVKIYKFIKKRLLPVLQKIVEEAIKKEVEPIAVDLATTKEEVKALRAELEANNIQTARVDLTMAIEHTPHEHEAILKLATNYFLHLGGDAWMSGLLRKWSESEKVDISYIAERAPHLKG